jgi:pimeloyl-ACP methyl ester carboxylesterase
MTTSRKFLVFLGIPVLILVIVYLSGPQPSTPRYDLTLPVVPAEAGALEEYVAATDAKHKIKPDNGARIVWKDSTRQKTEYAVVYIHGFSASQMEGDPVHRRFAQEFGCNLYLARLSDHGVDTTEALLLMTADRLWASAKEALAIGKQLGHKVILMSCSTGGTLSLKLAAEYPEDVDALINLSPNIALRSGSAFLLNKPWGLQIARKALGGNYNISEDNEEKAKYWNQKYRVEALPQLEELVATTMKLETFKRVRQPSLTLYYYKDEAHQDPQVSVSAILKMNDELGTPAAEKQIVNFPNAGAHVLGSPLASKDVEGVYSAIKKFATDVLHLNKVTMP